MPIVENAEHVRQLIEKRKASGWPIRRIIKELQAISSQYSLEHATTAQLKDDEWWKKAIEIGEVALVGTMELFNICVTRNLGGKEAEKDGNLRKAIVLYEDNVQDCFDGKFPYERLRIIYKKLGRDADAVRVMKAYLANEPIFDQVNAEKYKELIVKYGGQLVDPPAPKRIDNGFWKSF